MRYSDEIYRSIFPKVTDSNVKEVIESNVEKVESEPIKKESNVEPVEQTNTKMEIVEDGNNDNFGTSNGVDS